MLSCYHSNAKHSFKLLLKRPRDVMSYIREFKYSASIAWFKEVLLLTSCNSWSQQIGMEWVLYRSGVHINILGLCFDFPGNVDYPLIGFSLNEAFWKTVCPLKRVTNKIISGLMGYQQEGTFPKLDQDSPMV